MTNTTRTRIFFAGAAMLIAWASGAGGASSGSAMPAAPRPAVPAGPVTAADLEFRTRQHEVWHGTRQWPETLVVARDPRSGVDLWHSTARPSAIEAFLDAQQGGPGTAAVLARPDRLVRFFVAAPSLPHSPSLTEVRLEKGVWRITLYGSRGNSALVILGSDYRVLEVRKHR